jgi:hypothetical protein
MVYAKIFMKRWAFQRKIFGKLSKILLNILNRKWYCNTQ